MIRTIYMLGVALFGALMLRGTLRNRDAATGLTTLIGTDIAAAVFWPVTMPVAFYLRFIVGADFNDTTRMGGL